VQYKILPVEKVEKIRTNYIQITINDEEFASQCSPGNFFQIKAALASQNRRLFKPISVFQVEGYHISFIIKVIGPGTRALASLESGEKLMIYGPLGNSFPLVQDSNILLVSGGTGYPPLAYLKSKLDSSNNILFLDGGASKDDIFPCDYAYTIDGSLGIQGMVTKDIAEFLKKESFDCVYSCGPISMLKTLAQIVSQAKQYVSMEAYMACGMGVCYGCVIPTIDGYKRVCYDGPVFEAETILWAEL
jgi:dihydroorotate dehydrogenase electron transfer subunit